EKVEAACDIYVKLFLRKIRNGREKACRKLKGCAGSLGWVGEIVRDQARLSKDSTSLVRSSPALRRTRGKGLAQKPENRIAREEKPLAVPSSPPRKCFFPPRKQMLSQRDVLVIVLRSLPSSSGSIEPTRGGSTTSVRLSCTNRATRSS